MIIHGVLSRDTCYRWRFAYVHLFQHSIPNCSQLYSMLEMQEILAEFVEHFEFSPAPGNPEIIRSSAGIMTPM